MPHSSACRDSALRAVDAMSTSSPLKWIAAFATLGHSALVHRVLPARAYVPANLAAAGAATLAAHAAGISFDDLGLARSRLAPGVRAGVAAAAPLVAGTAILGALPATRRMFRGPRPPAPRPPPLQ